MLVLPCLAPEISPLGVVRSNDRSVNWLVGRLVGRFAGWLDDWLDDWSFSWLGGLLVAG